jgi:hypothetical protein
MPLPIITSLDFFIVSSLPDSAVRKNKKGVRTGRQGLSPLLRGDAIVLSAQFAIALGLHAATIDRAVI